MVMLGIAGVMRYRAAAEPSLVVLAALGIAALLGRRAAAGGERSPSSGDAAPEGSSTPTVFDQCTPGCNPSTR
jgi:hypothetical protein